MKRSLYLFPLLWGFLPVAALGENAIVDAQPQAATEPPTEWIEPATGHRVIRLSREPGTASLYFHQNPYTATGDKLFVTLRGGLGTIDLTTLGVSPPKVARIADGNAGAPVVGKKTRTVYYVRGGGIYATHLDTGATREVVKLPPGYSGASGLALNADETLLASTGRDPKAQELVKPYDKEVPGKDLGVVPGNRSMVLFTVHTKTGEINRVHYGTDWLNHTQFSPTDPNLLLFCHEGPWHHVNRVWTVRADGGGLRLMHARTMLNEIAGHEFFGHDGTWVWYDLQTPRSQEFWLAGVNIETGERIRYPIERAHWSVHFNQSHDGRLFAGDGGGPNSVANRTPLPDNKPLPTPGNGQWIYLYTSQNDKFETLKVGNESVKIGKLKVEKLVDLSKHDYRLEPNVSFTPDNKWIVFRSNMHGPTHVYAVEVKRSR
jgi:oligogalacturonide lyase